MVENRHIPIKSLVFKILVIFLVKIIYSCSDSPNEPVEELNNMPQFNISWSSLANSPWPIYHHDPQSTGRSQFPGPKQGVVDYKIPLYGIESSPVIDVYNNIYISDHFSQYKMHKFDISGNEIWEIQISASNATPILTSDSTIIMSTGYGNSIIASKLDGHILWENKIGGAYNIGINIGLDTNIYFVDLSHNLNVLNSSGQLLWQLHDDRFQEHSDGAPTFSPDGKNLYIQGTTVSVLAIDIINRKIIWEYGDSKLLSAPIVNNQGEIIIIPTYPSNNQKKLVCLKNNGTENWVFTYYTDFLYDNVEPTIDYNGNIYFGSDSLYSLNFEGKLRWKVDLGARKIISPLISDSENNIYIGTLQGLEERSFIYSFSSNGDKLWELEIFDEYILGASPAITSDGRMVFPTSTAHNIIIIK